MRDRIFRLIKRKFVLQTPPKNRHRQHQQSKREQESETTLSRRITKILHDSHDASKPYRVVTPPNKFLCDPSALEGIDGCPSFAKAYVGRRRWAKPIDRFPRIGPQKFESRSRRQCSSNRFPWKALLSLCHPERSRGICGSPGPSKCFRSIQQINLFLSTPPPPPKLDPPLPISFA